MGAIKPKWKSRPELITHNPPFAHLNFIDRQKLLKGFGFLILIRRVCLRQSCLSFSEIQQHQTSEANEKYTSPRQRDGERQRERCVCVFVCVRRWDMSILSRFSFEREMAPPGARKLAAATDAAAAAHMTVNPYSLPVGLLSNRSVGVLEKTNDWLSNDWDALLWNGKWIVKSRSWLIWNAWLQLNQFHPPSNPPANQSNTNL